MNEIDGLRRIKFVTNYPRHMTDDLLQAVRDLPKVSPYLHVPVQSGSNEQLKRMKRGYTVESYREMIERIRSIVPAAAITSDFIVGFCGETEEDFQQSVELVRWARFKNSFIFKYSERPGTKAAGAMPDDVPDEVKRRRNNELLAVQNAISLEDNLPLAGQDVEVLVEGPSKSRAEAGRGQRRGRAACRPLRAGPYRGLRRPADACRADPAGEDREGGCVYAVWTAAGFPPHAPLRGCPEETHGVRVDGPGSHW